MFLLCASLAPLGWISSSRVAPAKKSSVTSKEAPVIDAIVIAVPESRTDDCIGFRGGSAVVGSNASRPYLPERLAGAVRHPRTSSRGAHCPGNEPRSLRAVFLIWTAWTAWTARNPLKSPESDEGIQDNPSPFSWFGLVRVWFGLEKFGLRPFRRPRRLSVSPS